MPVGERAAYREYPAARQLARHLVCVWAQVTPRSGEAYLHRVLPDGCADLVCVGDRPPVVAGPATGAIMTALPPATLIVGARFRPGVAPAWLGMEACALRNATVALGELWGPAAGEVGERVATAGAAGGRLLALQAALAGRLVAVPAADPVVGGAVPWLAREGFRVDALARRVGLSPRQVLRRFRAWVGYGPKTLHRILRLQRLLMLAGGPDRGLGALALAAGYADQAHMTREVGELAGVTPRALVAGGGGATLRMSDLFKMGAAAAG